MLILVIFWEVSIPSFILVFRQLFVDKVCSI